MEFEQPTAAPDEGEGDDSADDGYTEYEEGLEDDEEEVPPDPVQRWLLIVVALIVTVFMVAGASLVFYVLSMRDAPRTSVERQINADEVAARENPNDLENWARLALSYADAGRWSEALSTVERGRRLRKAAILDLTEADILSLKGDPSCIAAYDRAIKSGQAEHDAQAKLLRETKGVTAPVPNTLVSEAMYGRTAALDKFGRTDEAIQQALKALELDPSNADLHVLLAAMYRKSGHEESAAAEYRSALVYVPDLEPALEGLRELGEEK